MDEYLGKCLAINKIALPFKHLVHGVLIKYRMSNLEGQNIGK